MLLNVLLIATLVWTEWMTPRARLFGYGVLATIWFFAWLESRADWRRYVAQLDITQLAPTEQPTDRSDRLFGEAQQCYLAGD